MSHEVVSPTTTSELCLLMAPLEETSSFLRGSSEGPAAVAAELESMELFDPELGLELEGPITTVRPPSSGRWGLEESLSDLEAEANRQLDRGAFVLTLGGEHTITLGPLRAAMRKWGEVGVVQLDAHGDLRDSYEGRKLNHACVMRRVVDDLGLRVLGLGIRSISDEEAAFLELTRAVRHLHPKEISTERVSEALDELPPKIYLTVDIDVFDPSVAPGVGTPEAGGLDWYQVADIIERIASQKSIIGGDIVELVPGVERARTVRLAARVALRVLLRSRRSAR